MVLVLAPCRTDIVTDLHYKMVVVVAPYRTDIVIDDTDMVLQQIGGGGGGPLQDRHCD